jgi:hypothetical protein|tara:strand:- start:5321 stop:5467 length:147 start_codon:yes stop_codon:yes gene_type:complete
MAAKGPNPADAPPSTPEGTLTASYNVAQNAKARAKTANRNTASPLAAG